MFHELEADLERMPALLLEHSVYQFYVNMRSYNHTTGSDFRAADSLLQMMADLRTSKNSKQFVNSLISWVQKYFSQYYNVDNEDDAIVINLDDTPLAVITYSEKLGIVEPVMCRKKYLDLCCRSLAAVNHSRFPITMIQISSLQLRVCGAVFGERISIQTLGSIDLWPFYDSSVQSKTAQLISALRQSHARDSISVNIDKQLEFPWFRSYGASGSRIDYISRVKSGMFAHIFEATLGSDDIVVKFTKHYHCDAHKICASLQMAPKLLHYETVKICLPIFRHWWYHLNSKFQLRCKWQVVVMERLPRTAKMLKDISKDNRSKYHQKVVAAISALHNNKFVHGDLRDNNIFVGINDEVWIVDFDWCGEDGVDIHLQCHLRLNGLRALETDNC